MRLWPLCQIHFGISSDTRDLQVGGAEKCKFEEKEEEEDNDDEW